MSKLSKQDFLNRLESFEKLLAEETFALRKGDFTYLNELLENKRIALDALVDAKAQAGIQRGQNEALDSRLTNAVHQQDTNRRTIAALIEKNLADQHQTKTGAKQVRAVCNTYTSAIASGKTQAAQAGFKA